MARLLNIPIPLPRGPWSAGRLLDAAKKQPESVTWSLRFPEEVSIAAGATATAAVAPRPDPGAGAGGSPGLVVRASRSFRRAVDGALPCNCLGGDSATPQSPPAQATPDPAQMSPVSPPPNPDPSPIQ